MSVSSTPTQGPRGAYLDRATALIGSGLVLAIGSLLTVPLMWDSYWWLLLTGGLALLAYLTAVSSGSRKAVVAVSVILAVAFWTVIVALIQVEVLDYPSPITGGGPISSVPGL